MHLYNLHCLRLGRFHWLSTEQNWPILSSQSSASVLLSFFILTGVCFFLSGHQFCFLTLSPSLYARSPQTNCTKCSVNPKLQSYMQTFGCGLQKVALRYHPRSCCSSWTCLCLSPWGFSSFCSFSQQSREVRWTSWPITVAPLLQWADAFWRRCASGECVALSKPGCSCDSCDVFPLTTSKDNN